MLDMRRPLHVFLGVMGLVAACGGSRSPSPSTETVATPASEREESSSPAPPGDPPPLRRADRVGPAVPSPADPCAGVDCGNGFCDLATVECVRAPCPRAPRCIEGTHPCAAMTCGPDAVCESHDGSGVCVPRADAGGGAACGPTTCAPGQVCCNASCGICTPPDGACTQQACE